MAAKGNCKGCCCGACAFLSKCHECCRCVPRAVCVRVNLLDSECDCNNCNPVYFLCSSGGRYIGNYNCGGTDIDLEIWIEKVGDDCFMFLSSDCLDVERESELLEIVGSNCADLPEITFEFTAGDNCAAVGCTQIQVKVKPIDVVENPLAKMCDGCGNCKCLPRCLCFDYNAPTEDESEFCTGGGLLCWDEESRTWSGSIELLGTFNSCEGACPETVTVTIALVKNDSNECTLVPTITGAHAGTGDAEVINQEAGCPFDLLASWQIGGADISVTGALCGFCSPVTECCPCLELETLTATLTSASGDCFNGDTIPLLFNGQRWLGSATINGIDVSIEFYCDPTNNWKLNLSTGCLGGTDGDCIEAQSEVCDPFEVFFSVFFDPECCGFPSSPESLAITITE